MTRAHPRLTGSWRIALAAALLGMLAPVLHAEELGRLFYTPQQRADMDRRRASNVQPAAPAAVAVDQITVDGRVTRSNGQTTTWINGVPQQNVRGGGNRPDRVVIRGDEQASTPLRVGETLDRTKGETRDLLQDGQIAVHPAQR